MHCQHSHLKWAKDGTLPAVTLTVTDCMKFDGTGFAVKQAQGTGAKVVKGEKRSVPGQIGSTDLYLVHAGV